MPRGAVAVGTPPRAAAGPRPAAPATAAQSTTPGAVACADAAGIVRIYLIGGGSLTCAAGLASLPAGTALRAPASTRAASAPNGLDLMWTGRGRLINRLTGEDVTNRFVAAGHAAPGGGPRLSARARTVRD